jgi:gamma-glutamylcyclotransferase (GGCT)/AIG2-like uncharacterized protein YtfP
MTRLFVYGTLAPGREAWSVLERWSTGVHQPAAVRGRLFDTGRGYPAATFDGSAPGLVYGTIVELDPDRLAAAWPALDRYEGDEYERIVVRTENGVETQTYAWIAALDRCRAVAGGRWA